MPRVMFRSNWPYIAWSGSFDSGLPVHIAMYGPKFIHTACGKVIEEDGCCVTAAGSYEITCGKCLNKPWS